MFCFLWKYYIDYKYKSEWKRISFTEYCSIVIISGVKLIVDICAGNFPYKICLLKIHLQDLTLYICMHFSVIFQSSMLKKYIHDGLIC